MAGATMPHPHAGHPAPRRDRVGGGALAFGLLAAPAAWFAQLLAGVTVSSLGCHAMLFGAHWLSIAVVLTLAALAVAVAGTLASWRSWHRSSGEQAGSHRELVEAGEGRTRFLAMCGLLTSGGFVVAGVFTLSLLILTPLCA